MHIIAIGRPFRGIGKGRLELAAEHGRIGIVPLVAHQLAADILGIGILHRYHDSSRRALIQDERISPVLLVSLGVEAHEQPVHAIFREIVHEQSRVLGPSGTAPAVGKSRPGSNRNRIPEPLIEIFENLRVADIVPEEEHRDIISLGNPVQIRLGNPVEDDLVVSGVSDHLRDDIVGGDGVFHFPEPQFKPEVAVHGETAGPYLSPVRLLPDAEDREMKQEQDGAEQCVQASSPSGKHIIPDAVEMERHPSGRLNEKRDQRHKGKV